MSIKNEFKIVKRKLLELKKHNNKGKIKKKTKKMRMYLKKSNNLNTNPKLVKISERNWDKQILIDYFNLN